MNYLEIMEAIIFLIVMVPISITLTILLTILLTRITFKGLDYVEKRKTKITR